MRCHYLSDLHLESQSFELHLPEGDVLLIAGDLCHARCLDPARADRYSIEQRDRVLRFIEAIIERFAAVLLVPGNHEPYDGVLEDTPALLRAHLPGVRVLADETAEIGGVRFFGSTMWSDFEGRSRAAMDGVRRRMGEYFFVKTRQSDGSLRKFRPEDALAAHEAALAALQTEASRAGRGPLVIVTHHAPSAKGLNPLFTGNGLDGAYASDLDEMIGGLDDVPVWVHGHTHIARTYRVGPTEIRSNALGFAARGQGAKGFRADAWFRV